MPLVLVELHFEKMREHVLSTIVLCTTLHDGISRYFSCCWRSDCRPFLLIGPYIFPWVRARAVLHVHFAHIMRGSSNMRMPIYGVILHRLTHALTRSWTHSLYNSHAQTHPTLGGLQMLPRVRESWKTMRCLFTEFVTLEHMNILQGIRICIFSWECLSAVLTKYCAAHVNSYNGGMMRNRSYYHMETILFRCNHNMWWTSSNNETQTQTKKAKTWLIIMS